MIINGTLVKLLSVSCAAHVQALFPSVGDIFPVEALYSRESLLHEGKLLLRIIQSQSNYHFLNMFYIQLNGYN